MLFGCFGKSQRNFGWKDFPNNKITDITKFFFVPHSPMPRNRSNMLETYQNSKYFGLKCCWCWYVQMLHYMQFSFDSKAFRLSKVLFAHSLRCSLQNVHELRKNTNTCIEYGWCNDFACICTNKWLISACIWSSLHCFRCQLYNNTSIDSLLLWTNATY